MSVPAANVRPHAFSTGSVSFDGTPIDLGFTDNAVFVMTSVVVVIESNVVGDHGGVTVNGGFVAFAVIQNTPKTGDATVAAIDRHTGDVTVAADDAIQIQPSASASTFTWAIHGYYWAPDVTN